MENQKLPNATAVLVLGILSIVGCCFYGIPSLIMGVVAIILARKDEAIYRENPTLYSNYSNLSTGKILAIIGMVLGVLYLGFMIFLISTIGWDAMQDQELMKERIEDLMGK